MMIYQDGYNISKKICKAYVEIGKLISEELDNTDEYDNNIENLKELVKLEDKIYDNLTLNDIDLYLNNIKISDNMTDLEKEIMCRYRDKLIIRKRLLKNEVLIFNKYLLEHFVYGMILIRVFQTIYDKIKNTTPDNYNDAIFSENLMTYFKECLFTYFSSSEIAEKVALLHNYDIEKIPLIDIEGLKSDSILQPFYLMNAFANTAMDNIVFLFENCKTNNDVIKVFHDLYNFYEIDVILSLASKKEFKQILSFYQDCENEYEDIDYVEITNVKKLLLRKNKEEFDY